MPAHLLLYVLFMTGSLVQAYACVTPFVHDQSDRVGDI